MKKNLRRTTLRLVTALLALSAVACGGPVDDAANDDATLAAHRAYTQEQFNKSQAASQDHVALTGDGEDQPIMGCSVVPDRCCATSGYCCTWPPGGGSPICG
ncbi:hypothetical protein [Hyalangium versicolor]|uniref:hypothetical protein n=1 Tax=Hyalangium versicolor TaxID=2861190 RepID=UPI001CCDCF69|nr:hypothetical protein [Hyalangium versicolor]